MGGILLVILLFLAIVKMASGVLKVLGCIAMFILIFSLLSRM